MNRSLRLGAAMPVVLGILVLVGILIALQFVRAKQQEDLVGVWQEKSISRWLAIAGRNLAIERLDAGDSSLLQGSAIEEWFAPGRRGVEVRMEREGLRWFAISLPLGKSAGSKRSKSEIGFVASRRPALVLLEPGDVVLGGDTRIVGDVAMTKGRFISNPWTLLPSGPNAGHRGQLDTTRFEIGLWAPRLEGVDAWWDSLFRTRVGAVGFDSILENRVLFRDGPVALGASVRWKGVRLVASTIRIATGAVLEDCLLIAKDTLIVSGKPRIRQGQYLSGDTLGVDMDGDVEGTPLFGVLYDGRPEKPDRGILEIRKMSGEAVLLSWARRGPVVGDKIRLVVGRESRLAGLAVTSGVLDATSATWAGTMVASRVGARKDGVWYGNALYDARLRGSDVGFWPLWFPKAGGRRVGRPIAWPDSGAS